MPVENLYLIAGTAFRIAVVLSGTLSTYWGYRLLLQGITVAPNAAGSDATARLGKVQLAFRNLSAGAVFSLFGMSVVAVVLYFAAPEFRQEKRLDGSTLVMRGNSSSTSDPDLRAANELLRLGRLQQAGEKYEDYFNTLATAANNFAWVLLHQSRVEEAITLGRFATALKPGDNNFVNTYVTALKQGGQQVESERVSAREAHLERTSPQDTRETNH